MTHAPVLDVEPPAQLPPVRPPSRFRSLFLVLAAFVLSASMGLVVAAPPAAALVQLLAPLVPHGLRIAPSAVKVLTGKTFMTPTVGMLGGGLALGAGGLYGDAGDGNWDDEAIWRKLGIKMPWDAKVEAVTPETNANDTPSNPYNVHAIITITKYNWESIEYSGVNYWTLRVEGDCVKGRNNSCPSSPTDAWHPGGVRAIAKCFNVDTGQFYEATVSPATMNGRQRTSSGQPPCFRGTSTATFVQDQIASIELVHSGTGNANIVNPEVVINPEFNPDIVPSPTITGTANCVHPTTGETRTVTNISETADALPVVNCPTGWTPTSVGWTSTLPDGTSKDLGGAQYDWSQFPQCADMSCVLRVTMDGIPCHVGIDDCYDWMRVEPKSRVACEYGPYALGLEQCRDLQHSYKSGAGVTPNPANPNQPQPRPNPDGTPNPDAPTRLVPSNPEGKPIPDLIPDTPKKPDPHPPTVPNPDPPGQPDPPTVSVPPPVANPPVVGNPPDLDAPPGSTQNCMRGMASWNPVDWVYTPVKCALTWAFVPKGGGGLGGIRDKFTMDGFGPWLAIPPLMFDQIPTGGGCMGPPLNMPSQLGGQTYYPFNACNDPAAKFATMSRSVITLVVGFWGVFSIVNSISTALTGYRLFERESTALAKEATNK